MSCSLRSRATHSRCVACTCGGEMRRDWGWSWKGCEKAPRTGGAWPAPGAAARSGRHGRARRGEVLAAAGCMRPMRCWKYARRVSGLPRLLTLTRRCATSGHVTVPIWRSLRAGQGRWPGSQAAARPHQEQSSPCHALPGVLCSCRAATARRLAPHPLQAAAGKSPRGAHLSPSLWLQKCLVSASSRASYTRWACGGVAAGAGR